MEKVVSRFLRYVRIHTESDPSAPPGVLPSAAREFDLARLLVDELRELGLTDAHVDEHCYVYATLPATPGCGALPVIGLLAHMDTSPDLTGKDVNPQILHYDGGELVINRELGVVMDAEHFPELDRFLGEDLIFADGRTLLGADDKGGIAVILQALEDLIAAGTPHGTVKVAFTPDEEIGRGTDHFDVPGFGARAAYTVDGGSIGGIEYENFNAAAAAVTVHGFNIHPGSAKNKMRSAILMAIEFNSMLPPAMIPAHTEGFEGFFHLGHMAGDETTATLSYIVRDHDMAKFEQKKEMLRDITAYLNKKYGAGTVELELRDQYFNMKKELADHMYLIDRANEAYRAIGVEPHSVAIRGGTDGAMLSYKGLPCPNLSTGGYNAHGPMEFASVQEMEQMVQVLLTLMQAR